MLTLVLAGLWIGACFVGMALLRDLQARLVPFFILYGLAFAGYLVAVWTLLRAERNAPLEQGSISKCGRRIPMRRTAASQGKILALIVGLAVLYRLTLLLTSPPTLSSDVYRYIWDGRLSNAGVSPYAHAVNSPLLDAYEGERAARAHVNNAWMASPYLPAAQALFWVVYRLAPDSPLAFQIAAVACDLLTGWMVVDLLRRLGLPVSRSLVYFWNPLLVVEVAHGAHVDAWMVCLVVAALWALVAAQDVGGGCLLAKSAPRNDRWRLLSVLALAAATLTKGLPALLLPVVARRWKARYVALYLALIIAICVPFAWRAGWGLRVPPDGTGLLGATLIYGAYWNFNSGLYHWLEVLLSGYPTPGPVPQEAAGWLPIYAAKALVGLLLGAVLWGVWRAQRARVPSGAPLALLRLAVVPLVAYLLLTTTVHPWYLTWVLPFAPFMLPVEAPLPAGKPRQVVKAPRFAGISLQAAAPLLYWTAVVPLSYLSYLDPAHPREVGWVRLVEYVPLYALLAWAAFPWMRAKLRFDGTADAAHAASAVEKEPEPGSRPPGTQSLPHRGPPRAPGPS